MVIVSTGPGVIEITFDAGEALAIAATASAASLTSEALLEQQFTTILQQLATDLANKVRQRVQGKLSKANLADLQSIETILDT